MGLGGCAEGSVSDGGLEGGVGEAGAAAAFLRFAGASVGVLPQITETMCAVGTRKGQKAEAVITPRVGKRVEKGKRVQCRRLA